MVVNIMIKKLNILFIFFLLMGSQAGLAQLISKYNGGTKKASTVIRPDFKGEKCGAGSLHDHLMKTDPVYKANHEKNESQIISD